MTSGVLGSFGVPALVFEPATWMCGAHGRWDMMRFRCEHGRRWECRREPGTWDGLQAN
jgi:hypothetical protein